MAKATKKKATRQQKKRYFVALDESYRAFLRALTRKSRRRTGAEAQMALDMWGRLEGVEPPQSAEDAAE